MTIQQLTYFRVLAETRHMGRAAEKLFLAQSSLSSAVAKLESELGVLLFERRGHHLVLTAEGTALLAHAETVLHPSGIFPIQSMPEGTSLALESRPFVTASVMTLCL